MSNWELKCGECLGLLKDIPSGTVDAVITDAPYSSGGQFRGDRMQGTGEKYVMKTTQVVREDFEGDTRDQRSFGYWCALWLSEALRASKPGAPIVLLIDWRQLPTLTDAMQAGGWVWRGIAVWDKTPAVRPQLGRYRQQAEFAIWGSNGAMPLREDVGVLPGVFRDFDAADTGNWETIRAAARALDMGEPDPFGVITSRRDEEAKIHQTGKPVCLMAELCRICPPGGLVLDPFSGSGSTGVGALRVGRRFLGFEKSAYWYGVARERLEAESAGVELQAHRRHQLGMFTEEQIGVLDESESTEDEEGQEA